MVKPLKTPKESSWGIRICNLNICGIKQAERVAESLKKEKIDAFYSSDLDRCVSTVVAIRTFHSNAPLVLTLNLRERHFGEFAGKKREEVDWDGLPGMFLERKPQGGESLQELSERLEQVLTEIQERY